MMRCVRRMGSAVAVAAVSGLLAAPLRVAAAEPAQDVADVRAAIQTLWERPFSREAAGAQQVVMAFAKQSDRVTVVVGPDVFQFTGSSYDATIMAHYMAGAVQFDLDHPDQARDPQADVAPALLAAVRVYRQLKDVNAVYYNPLLEAADLKDQRGELEAFAKTLAAKQAEREIEPMGSATPQ